MFEITGVYQVAPSIIRVIFDGIIVASDPSDPNDALNVSNYILNGPAVIFITNIKQVSNTDVDVYLNAALTNGTWTLQVSNVQDTSRDKVAPDTHAFENIYNKTLVAQANVNQTPNPTVRETLRKFLNPAFTGKEWEGVVDALANGLSKVIQNIEAASQQEHIISASGEYLDQFGKDFDFPRPFELGISEEDFRSLLIEVTNDKLTLQSFNKVLNIFYGDYNTRASSDSLAETFALTDGDDLTILFDEMRQVRVFFDSSDFDDISNATAVEVAAVINSAIIDNGFKDFAESYYDGYTSSTVVRLYSASIGNSGSVRIIGGKAQNILQFQELLSVAYVPATTWTIAKYPTASMPNYVRFTPSTTWDFSLLDNGCYVNIYGTEFNAANRGSFTITNVGPGFFEIDNIDGAAQSVLQLSSNSMLFFNPVKITLNSITSSAFAVQSSPATSKVVLPVTSRNIPRNLHDAAYLNSFSSVGISQAQVLVSDIARLYITTSASHGLSTGDEIMLEDLPCPSANGIFNVTVTGSNTFNLPLLDFDSSDIFVYKPIATVTFYALGSFVTQNGHVWICSQAGTTGVFAPTLSTVVGSVTQSGTAKFLYWEPSTSPSVISLSAEEGSFFNNYIFDSVSQLTIRQGFTTITSPINNNHTYRTIDVADSSVFPNEDGYLIFGLGEDYQTGPIHYTATPSSTTILIDTGSLFPFDIPTGADVTLLHSKAPFNPSPDSVIGICYLTGSHLGRVYAQATIDFNKGVGLNNIFDIKYPSSIGLANGDSALSGVKVNDVVYIWGDDELKDLQEAQDD